MKYSQLVRMQKDHGFWDDQQQINSGQVWKMEGSQGRHAMDLLSSGACMLPKTHYHDYYGNRVPSRDDLKSGTKGTFKNSVKFYENIDHYELLY